MLGAGATEALGATASGCACCGAGATVAIFGADARWDATTFEGASAICGTAIGKAKATIVRSDAATVRLRQPGAFSHRLSRGEAETDGLYPGSLMNASRQ